MLAHAVHVVGFAPFDFDLDGRVGDVKAPLDIAHDRAQHLLTFADALFRDQDVTAAGDDAWPDHPHVQVVNVDDAVHTLIAAISDGMSSPGGVPSRSTVALSRSTE